MVPISLHRGGTRQAPRIHQQTRTQRKGKQPPFNRVALGTLFSSQPLLILASLPGSSTEGPRAGEPP